MSTCYCREIREDQYSLNCVRCRCSFHLDCLKNGRPTPLHGDIFFSFLCATCSDTGMEECSRIKLQWVQVVMLALFNLQKTTGGRQGYFRWKEHICAFIDRHWLTFFGSSRKKTSTWYGTVAGALSSGHPEHFKSGTTDLGEHGWWALARKEPPTLHTVNSSKSHRRSKSPGSATMIDGVKEIRVEGLRTRRGKTCIEAAIELKAKRDATFEQKKKRKYKRASGGFLAPRPSLSSSHESMASFVSASSTPDGHLVQGEFTEDNESLGSHFDDSASSSKLSRSVSWRDDLHDESSQFSIGSSKSDQYLTERDLKAEEKVPEYLMRDDDDVMSDLLKGEDVSSDFESNMAINRSSPDILPSQSSSLPEMSEIMAAMDSESAVEGWHVLNHTVSEPYVTTFSDGLRSSGVPTFLEKANNATPSGVKQEPDWLPPDTQTSDSMTSHADNSTDYSQEFTPVSRENMSTPVSQITYSETQSLVKCEVDETLPEFGSDSVSTKGFSEGEASEVDEEAGTQEDEAGSQEEDAEPKAKRLKRGESSGLYQPKHRKIRTLPMSVTEEKQLLNDINSLNYESINNFKLKRMRRKLILRQLMGKEEHVDLENLYQNYRPLNQKYDIPNQNNECRILDRFQNPSCYRGTNNSVPLKFYQRLIGQEDDQRQPIVSPYTARVLKPFIRRDYTTEPIKLKLLREIASKASQKPQETYPIDFCYLRPQHIGVINNLAQEFIWPGIDLSECLHFPDFSCVVLYRRLVIGFAFMVPDVSFNEAYISFLWTHPEWRGAGIGTFMLYHLIQTCMGKDITLHVSATNPAMLLYQRFGFKPEEFVLDFYSRYLPAHSGDCRHAFYMRLRR